MLVLGRTASRRAVTPLARSLSATSLSPSLRVLALDCPSSSTASLSLVLNAGARHAASPGAAAVLKAFAFKRSKTASALKTVREAEHAGGVLSATLSREALAYTVEFKKGDEKQFLSLLASALQPLHLKHELDESAIHSVSVESATASSTPTIAALEAAHALAFRRGLGASLYADAAEPVSLGDVRALWDEAIKGEIAIVGTGIEQDKLVNLVKNVFAEALDHSSSTSSASLTETKTYSGEARLPIDLHSLPEALPTLLIAYAVPSAPSPSHLVLPYLLGASSTRSLKWASSDAPLSAAIANVGEGTKADAFLLPYSDAALLCVEVQAEGSKRLTQAGQEVAKALKALQVGEDEVKRAVAAARFDAARKFEAPESLRDHLVANVFNESVHSAEEAVSAFDSVSVESVKKVLEELLKSKPSVVSVARLGQMGYADELGL